MDEKLRRCSMFDYYMLDPLAPEVATCFRVEVNWLVEYVASHLQLRTNFLHPLIFFLFFKILPSSIYSN